MLHQRIPETDCGIQGEFDVAIYDRFQRTMRDRGWIETDAIIKTGIKRGIALEIGPGPGYLGLEWLKKTEGTRLKVLEISPDMIGVAKRNTREYGMENRIEFIESSGHHMPFQDNLFNAVFTNGSLHEWHSPQKTFNEIERVLKPGGRFFVSDLKRDISPPVKWFLKITAKPKSIRSGLETSLNAAYTSRELNEILKNTRITDYRVKTDPIGLTVTGRK